MRPGALALIALVTAFGDAFAQAPPATVEMAITGGGSTQEVGVAAAQVSIFGEPKPDWRYFVEGAWGSRSGTRSDAFGAAYPYDKRVRVIEAYGEKLFRRDRFFGAVRAGRYRTPFGIYGRSDHAYSGFLRAPMIRYDGYFALSNNFLEAGVDVVAGTPHVQFEASLGTPQDTGVARRPSALDRVFRVQAYTGTLIVGASYIHHLPYDRRSFIRGDASFVGLDARWMFGGVQVRGEWLTGRPHDTSSTDGWYVDVLVHRPQLGPVTLVFRGEDLDYPAGRFSFHAERLTTGAKVQFTRSLVAHVNVMRQTGQMMFPTDRSSLDAALTCVIRFPR